MAVIRKDKEYSPQSLEPSDLSPLSTPTMNLSTIEGWETPHTSTVDNTLYSQGEFRRVHWDISPNETFDTNEPRQITVASRPSPTPPPPTTTKEEAEHGNVFSSKMGNVAAHLRGMRPAPTSKKDTLMLSENSYTKTINRTRN